MIQHGFESWKAAKLEHLAIFLREIHDLTRRISSAFAGFRSLQTCFGPDKNSVDALFIEDGGC